MTVEAVDRALDDVRPYLIADGGNVDVVAVEGGRVFLQLQVRGCGTLKGCRAVHVGAPATSAPATETQPLAGSRACRPC